MTRPPAAHLALAALVLAGAPTISPAISPAMAQGAVDYEVVEIVLPQRRPEPPRPAAPPELPPTLRTAPPLSMEVVTRWDVEGDRASGEAPREQASNERPPAEQTPAEQTQRVLRTADRVLIESPDLGQQWLFEQNPVDPRRARGKLIIPGQLLVIEYPEADLADSRVAASWFEVMSLGLRPEILDDLTPTAETLAVGPVTARRCVPAEGAPRADGLIEIWWSDEHFIPLRIVHATATGQRIMEVRSIEPGADEASLRDPSGGPRLLQKMFTKVGVADWREDYHGNHIHIAGLPCGVVPAQRPAPVRRTP